jgi:hypothetical protein
MTTSGAYSFFSGFIADATDENILTTLTVLLQDQIWVICDLSHLHNETEDVGVVVEKDPLCDIGLEFPGTIVHDTTSKVILLFTEELTINIDLLGRKLHG